MGDSGELRLGHRPAVEIIADIFTKPSGLATWQFKKQLATVSSCESEAMIHQNMEEEQSDCASNRRSVLEYYN